MGRVTPRTSLVVSVFALALAVGCGASSGGGQGGTSQTGTAGQGNGGQSSGGSTSGTAGGNASNGGSTSGSAGGNTAGQAGSEPGNAGSSTGGAVNEGGASQGGEGGSSEPMADAGADFTPPERCQQAFDSGPCDGAFVVFAFVNGACEQESYGGCQGNDNRFNALEECMAICEGRPGSRPCPEGRTATQACVECGPAGGCDVLEVCAVECTQSEQCPSAGYLCTPEGHCDMVCF